MQFLRLSCICQVARGWEKKSVQISDTHRHKHCVATLAFAECHSSLLSDLCVLLVLCKLGKAFDQLAPRVCSNVKLPRPCRTRLSDQSSHSPRCYAKLLHPDVFTLASFGFPISLFAPVRRRNQLKLFLDLALLMHKLHLHVRHY